MSVTKISLVKWFALDHAIQEGHKQAAHPIEIISDGVAVLHCGGGKKGNGPWPLDATLERVMSAVDALDTKMTKEVKSILEQTRGLVEASRKTPQVAQAAGITLSDLNSLERVIREVDSGNRKAVRELTNQVANMDETAKAFMASAKAVTDATGIPLAAQMLKANTAELDKVIGDLQGLRIKSMGNIAYAWHICVSYVLPVMALVAAAIFGGVVGFGAGYMAFGGEGSEGVDNVVDMSATPAFG